MEWRERFDTLLDSIQVDVGRRGLAPLFAATRGDLLSACQELIQQPAGTVGLLTGFFIPGADRPETDGPPGAIFLARALHALNIPCALISDPFCRPALLAGLQECGLTIPIHDLPEVQSLGRWIVIERVGPAHDGRCYTMRGLDITERMQPVEAFVRAARSIGIGDGGNEIGMGKLPRDLIATHIRHGEKIACRVPTDHLIVAGISNWGAWALGVGMCLLRGVRPPLDEALEQRILQRMIDEGGLIDGVTGRSSLGVDGLAWNEYIRPFQEMSRIT